MTTLSKFYQNAVDSLCNDRSNLDNCYTFPYDNFNIGGCLFVFVRPSRYEMYRNDGKRTGCLLLIRKAVNDNTEPKVGWTDELTEKIRNNNALPQDWKTLKNSEDEEFRNYLIACAHQQMEIDEVLGRRTPGENLDDNGTF